MGTLMAAFAREFRTREQLYMAALRERGRIAESFRATVEEVIARAGVRPGSATRGEIEQALGEVCGERSLTQRTLAGRLAELIATARDDLGLTRREQEIASLMARGDSCAQIASELFVSQSTVRNHIHHIKTKLGLQTREELIALLRGEAPGAYDAGDEVKAEPVARERAQVGPRRATSGH